MIATLVTACASDHHVSPWGSAQRVPVDLYVPKADLAAELALVDRETTALGLTKTIEIRGTFGKGGEAFAIRGYDAKDPLGRPIHAVRVATGRAITLAVGPLDPHDLDRRRATELVPAFLPGPDAAKPLEGAAYASGTDLTGDGSPDVALRAESGAIEVWHLDPLGTAAYEIVIVTPATTGADVDRDGRVDLIGRVPGEAADAIAPALDDVATFEGARFTDTSAVALGYHRRRVVALDAAAAKADKPSDEERLRVALERAWHAVLAGDPPTTTLSALEKERVPARLRGELERWQRAVARAVVFTATRESSVGAKKALPAETGVPEKR